MWFLVWFCSEQNQLLDIISSQGHSLGQTLLVEATKRQPDTERDTNDQAST